MKFDNISYLRAIPVLVVLLIFTGSAHATSLSPAVTGLINTQKAPEDAIVLFDGSDFSHWTDQSGGSVKWRIVGGAAEVVSLSKEDFGGEWPKKRGIQTKRRFRDFKLHAEFLVPTGKQDNSGVYIQRRYEIQIVDSYAGHEHSNNCGAIYKQKQPDFNASKAPGDWQSYDITFRAARFTEKNGHLVKVENARITVYHNSVLIQDDVEILNKTGNGDEEGPEPGHLLLQDHGSKTRFRNVWILESPVQ